MDGGVKKSRVLIGCDRDSKPPQAQDISNPYHFQSSTRGSPSPTPPSYIHAYHQQPPQEPSIRQLPIPPNDRYKACPTSPVPQQQQSRKRTLSMQSPTHPHDEIHARSSTISPEEEPDRKRKREHPTKQPLESNPSSTTTSS